MPFSLHAAVVPSFLQILPALGRMVGKAEAHCRDRRLAAEDLTGARLAPDMWDLATQVYTACLQSAGALEGALAGEFLPVYPPVPHAFAALHGLVGDAIARVKAVPPGDVDALVGQGVVMRFSGHQMAFRAEAFLTGFALPNFLFHATTAYGILRMHGVPLGKVDFLGRVPVVAAE